ncbi:MAG TPA: AMP-binding protein, partial [Ornithinibacter sp.]|nr:AMP-binding protein [Ornithinibacter sp.]
MHETSTPLVLPETTDGSLADLPGRLAGADPGRVTFSVRSGGGWTDVTAATFAADVAALAKGFIAAGIGVGDAVGIMSRTRYEWTVADFALWSAGAVPVPIYETSSPDQVEWILPDSGAVGVLVESDAHLTAVERGRERLSALRDVWVIDAGDVDRLSRDGDHVDDGELEGRRSGLDRESIATVIYTSGTTGRPKGVELTHGNFLTLAENAAELLSAVVRADHASTLLFLPLAHVFARFIEVLAVTAGVRMG